MSEPDFPRPTRLRSRFGMQVSGDDIWPRPDIVPPIVAGLARGDSYSLFGLRRIGKSTVMTAVRERLAGSALVVHSDAQQFASLSALFEDILGGLPKGGLRERIAAGLGKAHIAESAMRRVAAVLKGAPEPGRAADDEAFLAYLPQVAASIAKQFERLDQPLVICVDELPMLCERLLSNPNGVRTVNELLAGLRHWRSQPQVAMFFTGSIGLRGLAKQHGINANHLSDTIVKVLPPLPRDEAELCLRALMAGAGCDWPPEMVDAVLDRMPDFHLGIMQYAFGELSSARVTSIEAVETVFEERVRPGIEHDFHAQFSERLKRRDGDLRGRLRRALALVGDRPGGIGIDDFGRAFITSDPADEIEDTIEILVEDGFIHWNPNTRMLRLSDGLVRAWWKTRPRIPLPA